MSWDFTRREMAERVGFEPTCPLRDKTLSRRPRYDHFGTSPNLRLYRPALAEELLDEPAALILSHPTGEREAMIETGQLEPSHR